MTTEVLITGASGFIGQSVLNELLNRGYKVCALIHENKIKPTQNLRFENLDLLDYEAVKTFFQNNKFENIIHLAWYSKEKVHVHNDNLLWLEASINLVRNFVENGGKKVLCAGSISEYDFSYGYCSEELTPRTNKSLYGQCKTALYNTLEVYCKNNNVDFKFPRNFNLYGPNEKPQRLMPSVINSCLKGEDVKVSDCLKFQDYLHVEDTARGIVDVFESDIQGAVNICSGKPVQLRYIVEKIAELTNFKGQILWGAIPAAFGDEVIVGNNEKLKSIGWQPKYTLDEGLKQTIDWWKEKQ